MLFGKNERAFAFTDGQYITASALHDLLGDSLSAEICDASFGSPEIRTFTLSYNGPVTVSGSTSLSIPDGWTALQYSVFAPNLVNNPAYITVDFSPFFSVSDTFQFHGFVAVGGSGASWTTAIPPYQSPQWRAHVAGSAVTFEGVEGDTLTAVRLLQSGNYSHYFHTVSADVAQNSAFDFSSVRVTFSDVHADSGNLYVLIGCPYVSPDAVPESGTIATTVSTASTSSESGGGGIIIDGIISAITGLIDSIIALFVPSLSVIQDWFSDVGDLLSDIWPDFDLIGYEAEILSIFDSTAGHTAVLSIPDIVVPVGSGSVTLLSARDVDVFANNPTINIGGTAMTLQVLIKTVFNWIFTAMFISTVLNKFRSIFAGGEVYTTSVEGDRA